LVVVFTCVVLVGCESAGEATNAVAMADAIKSFMFSSPCCGQQQPEALEYRPRFRRMGSKNGAAGED